MTYYRDFYNNQALSDPTRTLTIRSKWSKDWETRVNALLRVVVKSVVVNDCLALGTAKMGAFASSSAPMTPAKPRQFSYQYSSEKVNAFMEWLREQESRSLLEIVQRPGTARPEGEPWSNLYVRSAYQKGLAYGYDNLRKRSNEMVQKMGLDRSLLMPSFRPTSSIVSALMHQPFHADRLALLYTRVFDELKGVTAEMDKNISQILTDGMAMGLNPRTMGKALAEGMPDLHRGSPFQKARTRGTLIARTEVINTHQNAALNEYYGAEKSTGEVILIQWFATMDSRVRDTHAERHMRVYTKEEGYALSGEPNCRCALLPYIPAVQGMPAKASAAAKAACKKAIDREKDLGKAIPEVKIEEEITQEELFASKFPWIKVKEPPKFQTTYHAQAWCNRTYFNTSWDFTGCDVRPIQETVDSFHKLAVEFPEIADKIKYVGTYLGKKPSDLGGKWWPTNERFMPGDRSWAHASRDGVRIGLNPLWYGNYYTFSDSTARSAAGRFHPPPCSDIGSVMTHEFGHMVLNFFRNIPNTLSFEKVVRASGFGLFQETFRAFVRGHSDQSTLAEVSDYAMSSDEEGFAEAFSLLKGGASKDQVRYSKDMGGFLDFIKDAYRNKLLKIGEWKWLIDIPLEERQSVSMMDKDEFSKKYGLVW